MKYMTIFLTLVSLGLSISADASFRCSGGLVSLGDDYDNVDKKCGQPDHIKILQPADNISPTPSYPNAAIVQWFYGPRNGAVTQIVFGNNKVSNIRTYRPSGNTPEELYKKNP